MSVIYGGEAATMYAILVASTESAGNAIPFCASPIWLTIHPERSAHAIRVEVEPWVNTSEPVTLPLG